MKTFAAPIMFLAVLLSLSSAAYAETVNVYLCTQVQNSGLPPYQLAAYLDSGLISVARDNAPNSERIFSTKVNSTVTDVRFESPGFLLKVTRGGINPTMTFPAHLRSVLTNFPLDIDMVCVLSSYQKPDVGSPGGITVQN